MKPYAALAAAALLLAPAAAAQTPDMPVMGSSAASGEAAPPAPAGDEKQVTEVLTIGDAIGGGLGAGLARVTEPGGEYDVSIRFNEESGLARPEVYDWAATVPKILEGNAYGVIVVMLGANDRQTIRDGDKRYDFGTPEWTATYTARANQLLDQLATSGARVIWVAPPPMRDPDYDAAMQTIAGLQKGLVEARGMTFLDLRKDFTNPDGTYTDSTTDGAANIIKLRGRDGISFFKAGNNLMGEKLLAAIKEGEKPVEAPAAEKTSRLDVPEASKTDSEALPGAVPLFGQAVMDAEPYTVQPEGVTANAILLAAGDLGPEAALKTLRDIAPTGSGAESLFKLGSPEAAPAGRPDDFTAPAP
ncbi:hypothetical protein DK847_03260 [Aestuariivirga litoralis]|uniref:Uncharacterized protein n=1 Tax=Aestuariivirga litoralis TaxID=2650924 RepID=A0A2W2BZB3_9HYPH|nr:DUF459 domain-containing protein [Aestuariivirga litoralis]PZF78826.1 hypothetical protein DK847_03260 [Aestuariivirga litoralis]